MRRIAVLSAGILVLGLVWPSSALAEESTSHDDRWIAVEDHFAVVLANGDTFTEEEPVMEQVDAIPVGTRLFLSEALYATDDGATRGDEVGRTHIECTAQVVANNLLCDIAFVFDEGSQLHGTAHIDFSEQGPGQPEAFDIAVTGGTGDYSRASGQISLTDITDVDDPAAAVTTLYEADLD